MTGRIESYRVLVTTLALLVVAAVTFLALRGIQPITDSSTHTPISSSIIQLQQGESKEFPSTFCSFDTLITKWNERIPNIVQSRTQQTTTPSIASPFVFFHFRKAGGTTIRQSLADAAKHYNITSFIPCYNGVKCATYFIPDKTTKWALAGGHIYFADVLNKLGFTSKREVRSEQRFNCLLSIRPTVERVISCWNYRFSGQDGITVPGFVPADKLKPTEWDRNLPMYYSGYLEGCNNEIFRVLGDIASETRVNTLTSWNATRSHNNTLVMMEQQCALHTELDVVLSRMSQCIVTLSDRCEDNSIVIKHYAPWLEPFFPSCGDTKLNTGRIKSKNLTMGSEEVILAQNEMDEYAFQFGAALFEEQLRIAKESIP